MSIAINPEVALIHSYLGLLYILNQELRKARLPLDRALNIDPNHYHANFHRGLYFRLSGHPDSAILDYQKALTVKDHDYKLHSNICIAYLDLKMYDKALESCNQSIALNGSLAEQFINRGVAQLNLAKYDEALSDFNHALTLDPNNIRALLSKAKVYYKKDQLDLAIDAAQKAVTMNPNFADARHLYGILLIKKTGGKKGCDHIKIACELHDQYACETLRNVCKK